MNTTSHMTKELQKQAKLLDMIVTRTNRLRGKTICKYRFHYKEKPKEVVDIAVDVEHWKKEFGLQLVKEVASQLPTTIS